MARLDLGRRFGMAFIAFRSFQHLLTVDEQRTTLTWVRRHLRPDGRLALHLFDPRFDSAGQRKPAGHPAVRYRSRDATRGKRVVTRITTGKSVDFIASLVRCLNRA